MDNYADLIKRMAEVFMNIVRELETENYKLRCENELLSLEVRELKEGTDTYVYWGTKGV